MEGLNSPIIQKYELALDENPGSKVFAPLAESYRKIGMVDKALGILRQGIKHNPEYPLGHIGLAYCYYDMQEFNLAYTTLKPMVEDNRENLRLMKLFSQVCFAIGHEEESLEAAKYLLFLNPRDKEAAKIVKDLEDKTEANKIQYQMALDLETGKHTAVEVKLDNLEPKKTSIQEVDSWVKVDFPENAEGPVEENNLDNWNLKKQEAVLPQDSHEDFEERSFHVENPFREKTLEERYNEQIKEEESIEYPAEEESLQVVEKEVDTPVITHTLVDLYCSQGHVEKAVEILEKILELNPNDTKTIEKLEEVNQFLHIDEPEAVSENNEKELIDITDEQYTEEVGRQNLMSYFDEKFEPEEDEVLSNDAMQTEDNSDVDRIENLYWNFHKKLCERASFQLSK